MTVISVVLGLVCFGIGLEVVSRYRMDLIKIPVLNKVKTDRSLIDTEDIQWTRFPRKYIDEETIIDEEGLVGMYVKLNHTIYPGSPVLTKGLESLTLSHDDAILRLYENQSVFSLKTDLKQSFGGMLNVGHRVDLSMVIRQRNGESKAYTFLKQVRVIGAKNKNGKDVSEGDVPAVVLLAINTDALEMLLRYQVEGDLVMTLVEKDVDQECIIVDVVLDE